MRGILDSARDDKICEPICHFINNTERLRLISRVILRCMYAGMPVTRRGRILPLSVTNFSGDRDSCNRLLRAQYRSDAAALVDWRDGTRNGALAFLAALVATWFRGATCAAAKTDCISFSPGGSACADFSYFAWSCNARRVCPELSPRCIQECTISCAIRVTPSLPVGAASSSSVSPPSSSVNPNNEVTE